MQVHQGYQSFPKLSFPVVTTGTFDGVHLGHQTIIRQLTEQARKHQGESVVLTFNPHPRQILQPESANGLELLSTLEERIAQLSMLGVDHLVIIQFDLAFSQMSFLNFIKEVLVGKIHTRKLVIGYDHHFGSNREGSFESLLAHGSNYGFEVEEIPAQVINEMAISSTKIRKALHEGHIAIANSFLGRPYELSGEVIAGAQRGRTIGFPTANIEIADKKKLIPANGVYAVEVMISNSARTIHGMLNIGTRPTVSNDGSRSIEVHLINEQVDLYGEVLRVQFHHKIRDELRFADLEQLKQQLKRDKETVLDFFA
ncbi:MAG: bifunctional riboflavin kinase/FAD synthetase [Bacteroidia bacterium]|nr:bifunctional riboflavin kinase/FAD synthetase [Bacteroidia bacterium]MCC6768525.1 bifunctional riboflavin kinase/FAD synthetase [Bacteroidia bacterium]